MVTGIRLPFDLPEQAAIAVAALMASVAFYAIKKNYSFAYDKLSFTAPSAG